MADEQREQRGASWNELLTRTMELGLGVAVLTAESAQRFVNDMVSRGQVGQGESADLVDRLVKAGREQREALTHMIDDATQRTMKQMDLARRSEVDALQQRVDELERRLNAVSPGTAGTGDVDVTDQIT